VATPTATATKTAVTRVTPRAPIAGGGVAGVPEDATWVFFVVLGLSLIAASSILGYTARRRR
jgi:hypothetical protein